MDGLGKPGKGGMSKVHDFRRSLSRSHALADAAWWETVYRKAFPGFMAMVSVRNDGWAQRGGIDRVITLREGRTILIDEKVREKDWPDILLERWSDRNRRIPGWIQKDLACEFIAYAFLPSRRCYLLPFLILRKSWIDHGKRWIARAYDNTDRQFQVIHAVNNGYTTESIAIPIEMLLQSMTESMCVSWDAKKVLT